MTYITRLACEFHPLAAPAFNDGQGHQGEGSESSRRNLACDLVQITIEEESVNATGHLGGRLRWGERVQELFEDL